MIQALVSFIFNVISSLVEIIVSPFLSAIFALFPDLYQYFNYINQFLATALTYVSTILQWLCFTPSMFLLLFDYFAIKYTIHLTVVAVKFVITIYNKLKP